MSDSEVKIQVTANAAQAKAELASVGKAAGEAGKKAKDNAAAAHGAVLQLSGSVLSLKNGLSTLASGRGGVGAILQVAGAARSAAGVLKAAGGAGAVAAAGVAAGFAAAAAAVVGVGTEVAKASMGTEAWRKKSNDAVEAVVADVAEREGLELGILQEYVGHGIGTDMHEDPEVPNYGMAGHGELLEPGMVLAIEPMINMGTEKVRQLKNGWTVVTRDGKPEATLHAEKRFYNSTSSMMTEKTVMITVLSTESHHCEADSTEA